MVKKTEPRIRKTSLPSRIEFMFAVGSRNKKPVYQNPGFDFTEEELALFEAGKDRIRIIEGHLYVKVDEDITRYRPKREELKGMPEGAVVMFETGGRAKVIVNFYRYELR